MLLALILDWFLASPTQMRTQKKDLGYTYIDWYAKKTVGSIISVGFD